MPKFTPQQLDELYHQTLREMDELSRHSSTTVQV